MHVVHVQCIVYACANNVWPKRFGVLNSVDLCSCACTQKACARYLKGSYSELYDTALVTPSLRSPADLSIYYIYTIHRFPYRETPYSVPYDRIDILR